MGVVIYAWPRNQTTETEGAGCGALNRKGEARETRPAWRAGRDGGGARGAGRVGAVG